MKVLVVEDSMHLRENIELGLKKLNFIVDTVDNGKDALSFIRAYEYDVVLLDIMLPKMDGLEVLKHIKNDRITTGVIMLTALDQVKDRVNGLTLGADDYICKPFAFEELVARITTVSRRNSISNDFKILLGDVCVDIGLKEVRIRDEILLLTPTEYLIIEYIALNAGKVMTFEFFEEKLSSANKFMSRNALEVNISNIRKKLKKYNIIDFIKTKRGSGYFVEK